MNSGDSVFIKATVLRVEGSRLDAQTADGQLIQTAVENVMTEEKQPAAKKEEKSKTAEKKSDGRFEHKAELDAPENKSSKK